MNRLHTPAEAADVLKVTESWLKKRVAARSIPHTRVGRHIRFSDEHLQQIAVQGEVPAKVAPLRRKSA